MKLYIKAAAHAAPILPARYDEAVATDSECGSSVRLKEVAIHSLADTLWWLEALAAKLVSWHETGVSQRIPAVELLCRLNFVLDIFREQVRGRQMALRALSREVDSCFEQRLKRLSLDYRSLLPFIAAVEAFAQRSVKVGLRFPGPEKVQLLRMVSSVVDLTHQALLGEQEVLLRWHWLDFEATA